jgi:hypothetical protein
MRFALAMIYAKRWTVPPFERCMEKRSFIIMGSERLKRTS